MFLVKINKQKSDILTVAFFLINIKSAMALCLLLTACCLLWSGGHGLLYPKDSSNRELKELGGLWHFRLDTSINRNEGFEKQWFKQPLAKSGPVIKMPVPSSYNDITQDAQVRDFVGWAWYDREFWVPEHWLESKNTRVMLRFESAHYNTIAWVNGEELVKHSGGHLPFEEDTTNLLHTDKPNILTVAVNNTLGVHTLPPGSLSFHGPPSFPEGYFIQNLQMDFFNYAGLQRPVKLYTTPSSVHTDDITVTTTINSDGSATVQYSIEVGGSGASGAMVNVTLMERMGASVGTGTHELKLRPVGVAYRGSVTGSIKVETPKLWWPWTMSAESAYLYALQVNVSDGEARDVYRLAVGIRTVQVKDTQLLVNGKPFYCHGFGKHEDADIRGKGLDYPLLMKDVNLLLWLGASCFRTSHYPYSEELMELTDQEGIMVVDETPAVGLKLEDNFAQETLEHHKQVIQELVQRDKNRPSVLMWSLANEPRSDYPVAENYFKVLAELTKQLDPTRPITFACSQEYNKDRAAKFMDVVSINRYYGWYQNTGHPETINTSLSYDLDQWYATHGKPMMITEYGAGAVAGLHEDPPVMYTEDYQLEILSTTFPVLDEYKHKFLVGEMVWNFADFQTSQYVGRVDGNKKGVLTRQRQPKAAARLIRARYHSLAQGLQLCHDNSLLGHYPTFCPLK